MSDDTRPIKTIREKTVKDRVKKVLKRHNCYFFMPVQTGYGAPTLDFLGCHRSRFFSVETKAPGKKPTPRQELIMALINASGGAVFVIGESYNQTAKTFSGMEELEAWLLLGR